MLQGFRYCLTYVDRFTCWPEVFSVVDIDAATITRTLFAGGFARFGTPLRVTTDHGRQFESQLFKRLAILAGATHLRTTAYHPAANELGERFHRQLKAAIRCYKTERWTEILPTILLGIRSAWHEALGATAAELVYGEPLRLPGEFLISRRSSDCMDASEYIKELRQYFAKLRPIPGTRHGEGRTFVSNDLATVSHVFVRVDTQKGSPQQPYEEPFRVVSRGHGHKTCVVEVRGKHVTVPIDRVKPAYVISPDQGPAEGTAKDNDIYLARDEPARDTPNSRNYSDLSYTGCP
ncbi:protein NYNRIN-like [Neodiprion pinetum]|uniref:protein NYNRIN-like n=1 Tax=Neodiprion pinetum TaxID=441929 RepID=UPI001EE0B31A|nr:uncharacterized protein LOC124222286 [Neodiprion pinetum]